jgi:hypothetical protein
VVFLFAILSHLKIPKESSEVTIGRRTENTMVKRKNNDLQNTIQKTKEQATRNPQNSWSELRYSGRVSSSCSTSGTLTRHVTLVIRVIFA